MSHYNGLDAYISGMDDIHGGFEHPDPYVFAAISAAQTERGIGGDIIEIGAYLGRSTIALGYLIGEDETLHVCDLWPSPDPDDPDFLPETVGWYHAYTQEKFEANYLRFHNELPEIHAVSSLELPGTLTSDSFRFAHLDGGHTAEALDSDIALAEDLLIDEGVLSIWGHRTIHTLEVAAAVWGEVARSTLHPICATETHFYASVTAYTATQTADLYERLQAMPQVDVVLSNVRGADVALVQSVRTEPKLKRYVPPILLPSARKARSWLRRSQSE